MDLDWEKILTKTESVEVEDEVARVRESRYRFPGENRYLIPLYNLESEDLTVEDHGPKSTDGSEEAVDQYLLLTFRSGERKYKVEDVSGDTTQTETFINGQPFMVERTEWEGSFDMNGGGETEETSVYRGAHNFWQGTEETRVSNPGYPRNNDQKFETPSQVEYQEMPPWAIDFFDRESHVVPEMKVEEVKVDIPELEKITEKSEQLPEF